MARVKYSKYSKTTCLLVILISMFSYMCIFDWFQACVPTLVDISLDKDTGETVCLSSLQALTNLSVTPDHHGHYTRLVSRLYEFFSEESTGLQLQALKILINLSCNPDMVPHLLAAKVWPLKLDTVTVLKFWTLYSIHMFLSRNKK